jgi:hypothetical protein
MEQSASSSPEERLRSIEERLSHFEAIENIAQKCLANEASISTLSARIDTTERIEEVARHVQKWEWMAKYLSLTSAIIVFLASLWGIHSLRTFIEEIVTKQMAPTVARTTHDALILDGISRMDQSPDTAVSFFRSAFEEQHYDESGLIPLLSLLETTQRTDDARDVIAALKQDRTKYLHLKDPMSFNNVASLELLLGLDDEKYWESAREDLQLGEVITDPTDDNGLAFLYINYCRYFATQLDIQNARKYSGLIQKDFRTHLQQLKDTLTSDWAKRLSKRKPDSTKILAELRSEVDKALQAKARQTNRE